MEHLIPGQICMGLIRCVARLHHQQLTVRSLQPEVCRACWERPAVNSVEIGPTSPYHAKLCQVCTNKVITSMSERLNMPGAE